MPQPAKLKKPTETQAHAAVLIRVGIELEAQSDALQRIKGVLEQHSAVPAVLQAQVGKLVRRRDRPGDAA